MCIINVNACKMRISVLLILLCCTISISQKEKTGSIFTALAHSLYPKADEEVPDPNIDSHLRYLPIPTCYCAPGPPGPPGPPGQSGMSDVDEYDNYRKERLGAYRGIQGSPGPPGPPGPPGRNGKRSDLSGRPGEPGPSGKLGWSGPIGPPGRRGEPGYVGLQGPPGPIGTNGLPGIQGLPDMQEYGSTSSHSKSDDLSGFTFVNNKYKSVVIFEPKVIREVETDYSDRNKTLERI